MHLLTLSLTHLHAHSGMHACVCQDAKTHHLYNPLVSELPTCQMIATVKCYAYILKLVYFKLPNVFTATFSSVCPYL